MTTLTNNNQIRGRKDIGLAIWKAIEFSGKAREDIAFQLQVSVRMVNYWQEGSKLPSLNKVVQLADLLGCTIDSLLRN